ncbi:ribokinase [Candidatus Roizmanbacteria bacterium]|nr:ribokinase [Candidatus Roizmanbacteria bacterium]
MKKNILVAGSVNMDIVIEVERLPMKGETIDGKTIRYIPGGKGLNQAIAASRLGESVSFVGKVGLDDFGKQLLNFLKSENLDLSGVTEANISSGLAQIIVDRNGNNTIVILHGSNYEVTPEYIASQKELIENSSLVISQNEIPLESIDALFTLSKELGIPTILNPAPANNKTLKQLKNVDYLVVNEIELSLLAASKIILQDNDEIVSAAKKLKSLGPKVVVVTLGEKGVVTVSSEGIIKTEGKKVKVVDTTAAGDCFVGAFATQINKGKKIIESLEFANQAASLSVQKWGASSSLPTLKEMMIDS